MHAIAPAFSNPVDDSQRVFRAVMNAFARPGTVVTLRADLAPPPPLSAASAAVALALLDYETPVWLDDRLAAQPTVSDWLRFHTGAPLTANPGEAAFAFVSDPLSLPVFEQFSQGTMEYPDRSTTLVVQARTFNAGAALSLAGPGIAEAVSFAVDPQPADFAARLTANRALFPRGIDLVFVTEDSALALPRSVRVLRGD